MVCIRATILTNGSNGTDGLCSHKYLRFGGSWLEIATALPSSASAAGSTTPTAQRHRRARWARHVRWPTARNLAQKKECGKEQAQGFSSTSNPVILVGSTVPLCVGLHVSPSLTPAGTFAGPQQKLLLVAVRAHHLRYSTREKTDGIPALQRLSDRRGILGEPSNEMAQTSRRATASSPKFRKMMKVEPPSWATGLQVQKAIKPHFYLESIAGNWYCQRLDSWGAIELCSPGSTGMVLIQPISCRITGMRNDTQAAAIRMRGKMSRMEAMLAQAPEKG